MSYQSERSDFNEFVLSQERGLSKVRNVSVPFNSLCTIYARSVHEVEGNVTTINITIGQFKLLLD